MERQTGKEVLQILKQNVKLLLRFRASSNQQLSNWSTQSWLQSQISNCAVSWSLQCKDRALQKICSVYSRSQFANALQCHFFRPVLSDQIIPSLTLHHNLVLKFSFTGSIQAVFFNKLASSKMHKLKNWGGWEALKLANWQVDKLTSCQCQTDKTTWWEDDMMTWWHDDMMTAQCLAQWQR